MTDNGIAALAAALRSCGWTPALCEEEAAAILGEHGVFLPEGLLHGYDPLTDDEMAELIENPLLVHLYDAHRLVAALATIATLRADLDAWKATAAAQDDTIRWQAATIATLRAAISDAAAFDTEQAATIATLRAALDGLVKAAEAALPAVGYAAGVQAQAGLGDPEKALRAALAAAKEASDG